MLVICFYFDFKGLISADDPERLEICLNSAEVLIRRNPDGLDEVHVY